MGTHVGWDGAPSLHLQENEEWAAWGELQEEEEGSPEALVGTGEAGRTPMPLVPSCAS